MPPIKINGNILDTDAPTLRPLGLEADDASKSAYILIQTKPGPFEREMQAELESKEVVILEKVSEDTYLCGYKPEDLHTIRQLPYITYANPYQEFFVLQSGLKSRGDPTNGILPSVKKTSTPVDVRIQLHHDVTPTDDVLREIATAASLDPKFLNFRGDIVSATVEQQYLDEIAAIDAVKSIQESHPKQLFNNVARNIINADVTIDGTPFRGEGQVVAVADTGFDKGDLADIPAAFTGRVKHLYAVGRVANGTIAESSDDPNGHGTHVCGSVLGDGNSPDNGGRIEAPASKATLVVQSLLNARGGLSTPDNLMDLFAPPYKEHKARVHTNSWGSSQVPGRPFVQYPYDFDSEQIDQFVWENRDMVILFAAGNDGSDADKNGINDGPQIGSQASAKNCITVGATESVRKNGLTWSATRWGTPIANDPVANNPEGMAAFSSRGPTFEGRIKPDVVAPGTSILSSRSRVSPARTGWGTSTDAEWTYLGGTSMATPLVAGCCAVLRETWEKNGTNPSAALIKALLINGAVDVDGQYTPSEAGPSPNHSSGFGRVNLAGSIILPGDKPNAGWGDDEKGLDKGDKPVVIEIEIPKKSGQKRAADDEEGTKPSEGLQIQDGSNAEKTLELEADTDPTADDGPGPNEPFAARAYPSPTLKVTLVWSDYPGATLQNDLDLTVVAVDAKRERHGNQGTRNFRVGSKERFDRVNNVEQIVWKNIPAGKTQIIVTPYSITKGPQPWAYAWRIY